MPPDSHPDLTPGTFVRHRQQPDWGLGQVQSSIGSRITVTFEHVGRVVMIGQGDQLEPTEP